MALARSRQQYRPRWSPAHCGRLIIVGCILLVVAVYFCRPYIDSSIFREKQIKTNQFRNILKSKMDVPDRPSGRFVHIYNEDASDVNATCIDFKLEPPLEGETKLCLHNKSDDTIVSGFFLSGLTWEKSQLSSIGQILKAHPDMVFMDVGSHMGTYTMYANKVGNPVIAIDPLTKNLRLLRKSVQLVNQEDNVKILWNAVSNKHEKLYLEESQPGNIGSTHLVAADKVVNRERQAASYRIQTILLDDLLEVFELDNRTVMMKMDMEGSEWKALQGGTDFFRRVNVCYVQMEFFGHKVMATGPKIIDFMESHKLYPFNDFGVTGRHLPLNNTKDYAGDVVFAKITPECRRHI